MGALLVPTHYGTRRARVTGTSRIDDSERRIMLPEASGNSLDSVFMIGDTRVQGQAKKMGIPSKGEYHRYAQSRMTDLLRQLAAGEGVLSKGSAHQGWAVFERKLALVRYQFLAETDYYLSDATRPALPHGVVWRYMVLMVTNLWLRKDITTVGLDRDLVDVALRSSLDELRIRLGSSELSVLASQSVNSEWLKDAFQMFTDSGGKAARAAVDDEGGGGRALPQPKRCVCCGKAPGACGGYTEPGWACTADVKVPCVRCKLAHLVSGPRGWRCKGANAAHSVLSAGDFSKALKTSWTRFMAGDTGASQATRDSIRAAVDNA